MGGKVKGTPRAMAPVEEVDVAAARYEPLVLRAPCLTGFPLRAFVWLLKSHLLGPLVTFVLKKQNNMMQMLQRMVIPDIPMVFLEYPSQALIAIASPFPGRCCSSPSAMEVFSLPWRSETAPVQVLLSSRSSTLRE